MIPWEEATSEYQRVFYLRPEAGSVMPTADLIE